MDLGCPLLRGSSVRRFRRRAATPASFRIPHIYFVLCSTENFQIFVFERFDLQPEMTFEIQGFKSTFCLIFSQRLCSQQLCSHQQFVLYRFYVSIQLNFLCLFFGQHAFVHVTSWILSCCRILLNKKNKSNSPIIVFKLSNKCYDESRPQ